MAPYGDTIVANAGYQVDLAEDAERAWSLLGQGSYEALITDIELPGMSGLDLSERMRSDPELSDTPIVIVTARPTPEYEARAKNIGVAALLRKPVQRPTLLAALRSALET